MVAPLQDFVDLSSPSPPIRSCKIARSRKFSKSDAVTMDGIDLQHQSLLIGSMESKGNVVLCDVKNSALDHEPIDLSSPSPCAAHKPQAAPEGLPLCMEAERRALWDISNLPRKEPSCCKLEPGTGGFDVQVEESLLFRHGTGMAGEADSSQRSDGQSSEVVEPAMIDLSSPSPVKVDKSRRNDMKPNQDCEADSSQSPEHERKARELRLFLNSIRDELY
jgi:flap endonuclease GEN